MEREHWIFPLKAAFHTRGFFRASSVFRAFLTFMVWGILHPTILKNIWSQHLHVWRRFLQSYIGMAHGWPWAFFCCSHVGYRGLSAPWHGLRGHPCSESSEGKLGLLRLTMQGWSCLLLAMQVQHSFKNKVTAWKENMLFFYRSMEPLLPLEKKEKTQLGRIET